MKNRVDLIGHLGQNPKVVTFPSGGKLAEFTMATSYKYTDKKSGERKTITDWHRVKCNNKLADIVEKYLQKGALVSVGGMLKTETYDDKDGVTRRSTYVKMQDLLMLGDKNKSSNTTPTPAPATETPLPDNDDLPF